VKCTKMHRNDPFIAISIATEDGADVGRPPHHESAALVAQRCPPPLILGFSVIGLEYPANYAADRRCSLHSRDDGMRRADCGISTTVEGLWLRYLRQDGKTLRHAAALPAAV
jgi:hypothetical protein